MNIEQIRDALPDYARDLKLNLGSVLTTTGAPGLSEKQIWSIAVASAIAARNTSFARSIEAQSRAHLADVEVEGAKAARRGSAASETRAQAGVLAGSDAGETIIS